ncbi:MAG TPA: two-component regulator propeller domain-containing protein [Prolixibacteraceae bacterium]
MKNQLLTITVISWMGLALLSCQKEDPLKDHLTTFTTRDGLLNNYVNNLVIDSRGKLVVGSGSYSKEKDLYEGGISRFDGLNWVNYHTTDGLAMDWILSMAVDRLGNTWIGTNGGGVSKFDGSHWTTYTRADGLSANEVWSIAIDKDDTKWFGTSTALTKFDGVHWKSYGTGQVMAIAIDTAGNKWLGTGSVGLWKMDEAEKLYCYPIKGKEYNGFVMAITLDDQGNQWCSNSVGVSRFDGTSWITYTTDNGLASNEVNCLKADHQGNIWVGTNQGISRFDGVAWTNYLPGKYVQSIAFDAQGNKWIGTMGNGVIAWKD